MARSRINKRNIKQIEHNLLLIGVGVVVVIIILVFFGVKLLVNFSLFVEKKSDPTDVVEEQSLLIPPILDYLVDATNSARIDISGTASTGKFVKLYVNGKQVKDADVKSDGTFTLRNVMLESGENDIKAKVVDEKDKESKFSETTTVVYSNKAPELSVDFPSDGSSFGKDNNPLRVRGKTDADVKVTVNDFWAVVDGDGNYYYNLTLKGGDNEIKVVATDEAGNKTEKSLKVTYSE